MKHQAVTFKEFILKDKKNKAILWMIVISVVIQFSVFKYFYPFASFIHGDSFSYLEAAYKNLDINTYMVGYSKFLRLFSVFASSDTSLVAFQYLLIQSSSLFFLATLFYLYIPGKVTQIVLLCFMVLNPLFLHLANLVSSDCFFLSFSLIWFSLLIWVMESPSTKLIIWHTIVLFIAFTVRYNALIYPLISAVAFGLSNLSFRKKIASIGAGAVLCLFFVLFTSYKYKQLTGIWQYAPFSGWQLSNNAMFAYRYVDSADRKPTPKKFEILDNMIREYFDSTHDLKKFPFERIQASTFYMWSPGLSLFKYRNKLFKNDTTASELKKWASMGPFYKAYGLYIIKKYPFKYAQYFLWPNAQQYYAPPVEFLSLYNSGKDQVTAQARDWFGYKSQEVKTRTKNPKIWVLNYYPILSGIINVVMLFSLIFYILLRRWHHNRSFSKYVLLGSIVWILNAIFTIFASTAALRFQSFPILLTTSVALLLVDWMVQLLTYIKIYGETLNITNNYHQALNDSLFDEVGTRVIN